jgi:hypothetical protein
LPITTPGSFFSSCNTLAFAASFMAEASNSRVSLRSVKGGLATVTSTVLSPMILGCVVSADVTGRLSVARPCANAQGAVTKHPAVKNMIPAVYSVFTFG